MKKLISMFTALILCAAAVLIFPVSSSAVTLMNKYDFLTSYCGYITSKNEAYYDIGHLTTDFIAVNSGTVITAGPVVTGQKLYLSCYDKNKSLISQITSFSNLKVSDTLSGGQSIISMKVSSSVAYIRLTFGAEYYNTFLVTADQPFDAKRYEDWVGSQGYTKYIDFINSDKSKFAGNELIWCGDSVGHGSYEKYYDGAAKAGLKSGAGFAYAGRVADLLGFAKYTNPSTGGATITTKYPSNIISQKIDKYANKDTKYLIIEGGIVDVCGYGDKVVPVGYMSDSFDPSTFADKSTFIGGLEYNFYLATTKAPDAVIAFVMCYELYSSSTGQFAWDRIWKYVPPVCEKWGIPLIDLYNNPQVRKVIELDPKSKSFFYYDSLHCTPHGYTAISLEVAMELRDIPAYSAANRKKPENIPAEYAKATWRKLDPGSPDITVADERNLFNPNKAFSGYMNEKGQVLDKDQFITSDMIAVKPGDRVYFGPCSPYLTCAILGYDANKKISTSMQNSLHMDGAVSLPSGYHIYTYTVPENVYYIRATFTNNVTPVIVLNSPVSADDYNGMLEEAVKNGGGKIIGAPENLLVMDETVSGRISSADGSIVPDTSMITTGIIPVIPGDKLFVGPFASSEMFTLSIYNVRQELLVPEVSHYRFTADTTYSDGREVYMYTLPTNVAYIRISVPAGSFPFVTTGRALSEFEYGIIAPETESPVQTDQDTAGTPDTDGTDSTPVNEKGCSSAFGLSSAVFIPFFAAAIPAKKEKTHLNKNTGASQK